MEPLILAITGIEGNCDPAKPILCVPPSVNELFESPTVFSIGGVGINRTMLLMVLAALVVIALLWVAYGRVRLVPTKFGAAIEGVVGFVHDDVAIGVIGSEGARYFPYLLSLFLFILVGNLFGVVPHVSFPVTARMAIPMFLSLVTWFIFVIVGFVKNGPGYVLSIVWPRSVPLGLRWFIGFLELISTFILRPFTLAVRLFANMVSGHLLLTVLLGSGVVFISQLDMSMITGVLWLAFGLLIYPFEIFVAVLQAYVFTLLAAVYIQTSVHIEH
jgi:F-type H+-transporting ATPase subunit a